MTAHRPPSSHALRLALGLLGTLPPILLASPSQLVAQEDRYQVAIQRALQEFQSGHFEEARSFFRQAHRESPNPRTLRGIAMASYELRDYPEAYRSIRQALSFGPSDRDLTAEQRTAAAELLDRTTALIGIITGVPTNATVTIDGAAARIESDGSLLFRLGTHHLVVTFADGRTADLDFDVAGGENVALPQPAIDIAATRARGRAAYEAGRFEEAATAYEQAATAVATDAGLWAAVGVSRLALHQPAAAIEAYRRAIALAPATAGFHVGLGRALLESGDAAGARTEFEAALAIDPRNQDARTGLARTQPTQPATTQPATTQPATTQPATTSEPVESPPDVEPVEMPPREEPRQDEPRQDEPRQDEPIDVPPVQTSDAPDESTRFRFHLFGMGAVGGYESQGGRLAAGGGGGLAGLVQLGSVYGIGLQAAVTYASLAELDSLSDTSYWLQTDVLLWNELRFGPLGINVGLGLALGVREASTFEDGFRTVGTRIDPAFGLAADVRVYFADDLLFLAAGGRFAFGDFGAMAGTLSFGVEPVR